MKEEEPTQAERRESAQDRLQSLTFPIVSKRKPNGDVEIRRIWAYDAPLTLAPEAARQVTKAMEKGENIDALLTELKLEIANGAERNAGLLRLHFCEVNATWNKRIATEIAAEKSALGGLRRRWDTTMASYVDTCTRLGVRPRLDEEFVGFAEDEPISLKDAGAQVGIETPSADPPAYVGCSKIATMLLGALFGTTLGIANGRIEWSNLAREMPSLIIWSAVGSLAYYLLMPLFYLMEVLFGRALRSRVSWVPTALFLSLLIFVVGSAIAVYNIDVEVEALGLKIAWDREADMFTTTSPTIDDLQLVASAIVLLIFIGHISIAALEAERKWRRAQATEHREVLRMVQRNSSDWAGAQLSLMELRNLAPPIRKHEAAIDALEGQYRHTLTLEQRQAIQEAEAMVQLSSDVAKGFMDAYAATYADGKPGRMERPDRILRNRRRPWWAWWSRR